MDIVTSRDMPSDDLQVAIKEAQATLQQAGDTLIPRDPQRLVLAGMSHLLGVLGRSTTRWERAVGDVIAARDPLPKVERDALKAEILTAVEDGAFKGMRLEAQRMLRTFDRSQARNTGLAVAGALVIGASLAFFAGWWVFTPPSQLACADQNDGSRVCWMYTRLPTPPAPTTPKR